MLFCPSPPVLMRWGWDETLSSTTGDRHQRNWKDMQKPSSNKRTETSYLPSRRCGRQPRLSASISLCTVYRKGAEPILSFLDLVRVLQDTLSFQSATSFLQGPGLYTIISQHQSLRVILVPESKAQVCSLGSRGVGIDHRETYEVSGLKT